MKEGHQHAFGNVSKYGVFPERFSYTANDSCQQNVDSRNDYPTQTTTAVSKTLVPGLWALICVLICVPVFAPIFTQLTSQNKSSAFESRKSKITKNHPQEYGIKPSSSLWFLTQDEHLEQSTNSPESRKLKASTKSTLEHGKDRNENVDQPEDVTRANTNRRGRFLGNAVGDALARAILGRRWEIPLESTPIVRHHIFHVLAVFSWKLLAQ